MRNPKFLKTGPEFYKTQIYLENYLLILTNIQTWVNYRLYSQDLANLVQENIGFNFKTVYQMFRFRTRFLPESRKSWRVFLIILCLILYDPVSGPTIGLGCFQAKHYFHTHNLQCLVFYFLVFILEFN